MTDHDDPRPDQQSPDETRTQWVPADRPPAEPSSTPEEPGGWFTPAAPPAGDQPQWANWDQPWDPSDEPFDQAAQVPPPSSYPGHGASASDPRAPFVEPTGPRNAPAGPGNAATGHGNAHPSSFANLHALRLLAQVACPILLLVGLSFDDDAARNGWHDYTAWAVFAAVCAVVQLAPLAGRSLGLTTENAWFLAAVGTAGLVGYWVIIVLPGVSSNTGFAQTLAAGFAVIGLWLSPGRRV